MIREPHCSLFDLAICISDACDLVSPVLANHHKQVAYIAFSIGNEMGLEDYRLNDLVLAGAIHDVGALALGERMDLMDFDLVDTNKHARVGYNLLRQFKPTERIAEIILHHHHHWDGSNDDGVPEGNVMVESDILHLADRIASLIIHTKNIISQFEAILQEILKYRRTLFGPDICNAFVSLSKKEYFWLDTISPTIYRTLRQRTRMHSLALDLSLLNDFALIFARIIDFRSRFTATHSAGVAETARKLAELIGFSRRECRYIHIAGLLHDLGKLAVPRDILEKPDRLTKAEFDVIKTHTYHTYRILDTLDSFDVINTWAAFHHERIDASGYPFHHDGDDLSLGSRIMCVSDIFTAISEDRPYRSGMSPEKVIEIITSMAADNSIDDDIVALLKANFDAVNTARIRTQVESKKLYDSMFN
jgi:HD-GYP domain-containing protein (c-di-GMP phosphodiesterase class II)